MLFGLVHFIFIQNHRNESRKNSASLFPAENCQSQLFRSKNLVTTVLCTTTATLLMQSESAAAMQAGRASEKWNPLNGSQYKYNNALLQIAPGLNGYLLENHLDLYKW